MVYTAVLYSASLASCRTRGGTAGGSADDRVYELLQRRELFGVDQLKHLRHRGFSESQIFDGSKVSRANPTEGIPE